MTDNLNLFCVTTSLHDSHILKISSQTPSILCIIDLYFDESEVK